MPRELVALRVGDDERRAAARRVRVERIDGFAGLKAVLPPPSRRALVLIDPSYEDKRDYARVGDSSEGSLRAPAEAGLYEVRYLDVSGRKVLGRAIVAVK